MPLSPGGMLSHYRLVEKIGEGGMGIVWKADDTVLGRQVAIKVLPDDFARDADRLARFRQEARLLASLNHPNIAAIYGLEESDGVRYLVLELVPGQTLAERLARGGSLPIDDALTVCHQIAEALEVAHERGVIHRDLKPANVKVTPDGKVKVLDFGLAKAFEADAISADLSHSPTLTSPPTRAGVLLGTAAFMSPEQARGKPLDRRTDIWSFGCVLYEVLTGKQAFGGETVSDTLAAILKQDPEWTILPGSTPARIHELLRRCLRRDAHRRLQHIGDARIQIEDAREDPVTIAGAAAARPDALERWRSALWAIAGMIVAGASAWLLMSPPSSPPRPTARLAIPISNMTPVDPSTDLALALSPDGTRIVYSGSDEGITQLYLREMSRMEAEPIEGTAGAQIANFSPDGERLSFMAESRLKTVPVSGGPSTDLASASGLSATWAPGDTLIYSPSIDGGLSQIPASGGSPTVLTIPDSTLGEFGHWLPVMLPDGKTVLFTIWTTGSLEETKIALLDLETREYRTIITGGTHARYASSGHLVYAKGETLMAVPFDLDRLEITGAAAPVVENVAMNIGNGTSYFEFSEDGSLIYAQSDLQSYSIEWVDRDGNVETITDLGRNARTPDLSPGDGRLSVAITSESNEDIWTYDLSRGTLTRLTTEGRGQFGARWTPDGKRIAFSSDTPPYDIFWMPADGSGPAEPLIQGDEDKRLGDWSPDGRVLSYAQVSTTTQNDLWTIRLDGDRPPEPFLKTPFAEHHPAFSPDGRWLAYSSDLSGRFEVYATPFPGPGERLQISTEGGTEPAWSSDGQELFYRSGDAMLVVAIDTDPALTIGPPRVLFERALGYSIHSNVRQYDVSADGRRFLMINRAQAAAGSTQINVVLNWFGELKRLVPPDSD